MSKKILINSVFTPRRSIVNENMYISRPDHERSLVRSIRGSLHTIISGESGSGKSWLYKKVADDNQWILYKGNFANASRDGSVTKEICNTLVSKGSRSCESITETMEGGINAGFLKGGAKSVKDYSLKQSESIEAAFKSARQAAGSREVVLALDNLETVFHNKSLMEELGNILILLDDDRYAQYDIKILIVGVPNDIINYYNTIDNLQTIGNRIQELPPLMSLMYPQVSRFVRKGFEELLEIDIPSSELEKLTNHIFHITLGIPQKLHEYCEHLGYEIEENGWLYSKGLVKFANSSFMNSSICLNDAVIGNCMGIRSSGVSRKNQVMYSLSKINTPLFDVKDVEKRVRDDFPNTTKGVNLAIGKILKDLAGEGKQLIKKVKAMNKYRFSDPKYLMAMRMILHKQSSENVVKLELRR